MAPIIVSATLGVANAILSEAYISFLGLGVQPPTATWGNMLDGAYNYIDTAPWLWIFPGTADRADCPEHQLSGRWPAGRARPDNRHLT